MPSRRADEVFEGLALSILRGELREGEALASERTLADALDASRGTVRQAVHRLAEAGLVRVSQGAPTIVLRHEDSIDVRVIALRYRELGETERREVAERRLLQGLTLVYLASLRATPDGVAPLVDALDAFVARGAPREELGSLDAAIWTGIAALGRNRFLEREVAWWYKNGPHDAASGERTDLLASVEARVAFYRELLRRLRERDRAAAYYFDLMGVLLPA